MPRFNYKFHRFARIMKRSGGEKIFTFSTVTDHYLDEYTKIVFLEFRAGAAQSTYPEDKF
ncbi:hypothetical protein ACI8B_50194 [Acinetobacter proteolyticus]|uniref:Uncharacterized protein n=1 Tax=Acinetobacter proteolyticus TaxID=1776741 RepID=A0A653K9N8_9GAMM|nr:hypothetical protein ACI8B_50194 [Acinetobacter proteolyticus]